MKKIAIFTALTIAAQLMTGLSACASYESNTGTVDLSAMTVTGEGISVLKNTIHITEGGDFTVTGENDNAMIHVDAQDKVKLRLSGMKITNQSGPAIFFENTEKALITVTEETENYLTDGADYGEIEAKAALFSNDDMEIKGNGILHVTGNFKHGIATDDDFSLENGTVFVTSNGSDGIHTNNTFEMTGGTLHISAVSDGIQAEENVVISGGVLNITKSEEGIESGTTMDISGGEINIVALDDGINTGGGLSDGTQDMGFGGGMTPPEGDMQNMRPGRGQYPMDENMPEGMEHRLPPAGMIPPKGTENMTSPEGFTPPEGGFGGMGGGRIPGEVSIGNDLTISGGTVSISASGDGIDTNGDFYLTGGKVSVNGPENAGNGAIDAYLFEATGGELIALGMSGMAMGVGTGSSQCAFMVSLADMAESGAEIKVTDASGETVYAYTAEKRFNSIVLTTPKLQEGKTYKVVINGTEKQTVEMTAKQVRVGMAGGFGGMGGKGFGNRGNRNPGEKPIRVMLHDKEILFDAQPMIQNDTTLVPVRAIFEALGMEVLWDADNRTVRATKDDITIKLVIGSTKADKGGETIQLLTAPIISQEGRTFVPVRFIAESTGYTVDWDAENRTVNIH